MNCAISNQQASPSVEPLWLNVRQGDHEEYFELSASADQAIVVGSSAAADIRIPDTPPVAFFIERDGQTIWLTPAYIDSQLRVDTRRLESPRRVYRSAIVELGVARLLLRVEAEPPTLRAGIAVRTHRKAPVVDDEAITQEFSRSSLIAALRQPMTTSYAPHDLLKPEALPTCTVRTDLILFDDAPTPTQARLRKLSAASPKAPAARRTPILLPPQSPHRLRPNPWMHGVEKLGLLTKRRPFMVAGAALLTATFLFVFLVGAAQLLKLALSSSHVDPTSTPLHSQKD